MTRELVPGRCGLRRNPPFQGRMEALNWKTRGANLGRTSSDCALPRAPVRDALSLLAKDGRQNIRDNNAARVAGPGRIFFWRSAVSRLDQGLSRGTAFFDFQFDNQRQMIRTDALTGLRRNDTNITANQAMIDRYHQPTKTQERRP